LASIVKQSAGSRWNEAAERGKLRSALGRLWMKLTLPCCALVVVCAIAGAGTAIAGGEVCEGQPATIVGTNPSGQTLNGTVNDDVIVALGGGDTITAATLSRAARAATA
jgi:hypothetical protein